jgi:hypothetical protein
MSYYLLDELTTDVSEDKKMFLTINCKIVIK